MRASENIYKSVLGEKRREFILFSIRVILLVLLDIFGESNNFKDCLSVFPISVVIHIKLQFG